MLAYMLGALTMVAIETAEGYMTPQPRRVTANTCAPADECILIYRPAGHPELNLICTLEDPPRCWDEPPQGYHR